MVKMTKEAGRIAPLLGAASTDPDAKKLEDNGPSISLGLMEASSGGQIFDLIRGLGRKMRSKLVDPNP
jgi:hypothetical protein